jgi:YHS domain-containing protein
MKKILSATLLCTILIMTACGNATSPSKDMAKSDTIAKADTDTTTEKTYDLALLDNKKDPTCGMPVSAGVTDTAHYDHKVYGFCSSGCKDEFLKNPKANIAAAELK